MPSADPLPAVPPPSPSALALDAYLDGGARLSDLAAALGVTAEAVRSWRSGSNTPRADHATRLQRATHGAVPADGWAR